VADAPGAGLVGDASVAAGGVADGSSPPAGAAEHPAVMSSAVIPAAPHVVMMSFLST
jgi:hypothetical protein